MRLEEVFDLTLPDNRVEKVVTVGDFYDGVGALLQRRR
jgi:acyl carrier protein